MPEGRFELVILCDQKKSRDVLKTIKDLKVDFRVKERSAFAPVSPETALSIIVSVAQFLPIVIQLVKKLREKGAYLDFETRHRLAKKMLADFEPLVWIKGKDSKDYSYYEFKTSKCSHYWELDRGEITFGPKDCH